MPKVMDSRGNIVDVCLPPPIIVNGTFAVSNPENGSKNPAYKSIHSTSVVLPVK